MMRCIAALLLGLAVLATLAVPTAHADTPPLAARYEVQITAPAAKAAPPRTLQWLLLRSDDRIELRKGAIDETWTRDPQGRIAFARTFHEHAKVADYSSGELATLGVQVDWAALASFVDPQEMAALQLRARSGRGAIERLRYEGRIGDEQLRIDWLPALQLPALVQRGSRARGLTRIALKSHQTALPPPDPRTADYLHLDAADFGDMDYEPVVRLSEALDIRSGWRKPHRHD